MEAFALFAFVIILFVAMRGIAKMYSKGEHAIIAVIGIGLFLFALIFLIATGA